ncbi:MAG: Ig-like domain-containing protein [Cyanobacteria bacterium P01_H01_bin.35]
MATFHVTTFLDDGDGSLRDAIEQANATLDADTITFDSSLTGQTIGLTSGELFITNPLTINGLGANLLTVDAQNNGFRVFNIDNNSDDFINVFINGLTITGGNPIGGGGGIFTSENLTVQDSIISGNTSTGIAGQYDRYESIDGGGINSHGGYLQIINTQIINNEVIGQLADGVHSDLVENGHDFGDDPDGGGVSINNGTLRIVDSTISDNTVSGGLSDGGGVYGWKSDITITNSTISGNTVEGTALGSGGGIYNRYGNTTVIGSTIADNSTYMTDDFGSGDGGGIFSRNGDLEVINSTISGNSAYGQDRTDGGGVYSRNGNLTVVNSTISYNSVGGNNADGGGIYSRNGTATITNATISHNSADGRGDGLFSTGTTNLSNTIIANSINGDDAYLNSSNINTNVNNLIEDGTYNPFLSGDPGLGILQDNGGPTETQALLANSPAIDAGNTNENNDQRGALRDSNPDIGAFEFGAIALPIETITEENMAVIFSETFETDGNGTRYTTSIPEFSDTDSDFFTRTNGSNISGTYEVVDPEGSFYFAAQDIDGESDPSQQTVTISAIDISGFTNLNFSTLLAEDDDGDINEDWDATDFILFEYQIDGGGFNNLLAIENDGSGTNSAPFQDTDFDGIGDGTEVTDSFALFSGGIAGTGSTLDLRITFDLNSGDEDIAIDDIQITGNTGGDINAPTVESFTPADDATGIAIGANLVIDFDENVQAGTGNIVIKQLSDDSVVETIDIGLVSISNDTVTIDPAADLAAGTEYYVEIDAGAIQDSAGNDYAGISGNSAWNFTTTDNSSPTVTTLTPSDNAMGVAIGGNLEITFDEDVVKGSSGNIVIKQASNDEIFETISVSSAQVEVNADTVTIDPSSNLDPLTEYYVEISSGSFKDTSENDYQGISDTTTWNFTTAGETIAIRRGNEILFDYDSDDTTDQSLTYGTGVNEDEYLVGDWDGDGVDEIAVRRNEKIYMDYDGAAGHDNIFAFGNGNNEDEYLVGDWDGDGTDEIAVRRNHRIYMDYDGAAGHDNIFAFGNGNSEDEYLVGDWDGDGTDEIAIRRNNTIYMDYDGVSGTENIFAFGNGNSEDEYLVGDWDNDSTDEIAIRRNNTIYMDYDGVSGVENILTLGNGNTEDQYLVGIFSDFGVV